ncbi:MAG: glycine cleavage system aminomethyltransferase GcvT [Candidatus Hodarchaeota archaeon]
METQLYEWHAKNGDLVEFAGFKMPVMFSSIKEEHMAVRNAVGLFDVSHMGRMWIEGKDSEKFLNLLVPRDLSKTAVGKAAYTFMLNEQGGFRDDLVFERIEKNKWLLVWNAGNLLKIELWMKTLKSFLNQYINLEVSLANISNNSAMYALQGPNAHDVLVKAGNGYFEPPSPWEVVSSILNEVEVIISGTGYTGEAGFEIIVLNTSVKDPIKALNVWEHLLKSGKNYGIKPCGLGARDSLRLEAGYSLYGKDIDEFRNPIEANLFFPPFVHMEKSFFIGKSQLEIYQKNEPSHVRIGFSALKKGPSPRSGFKLFKKSTEIGFISSGGFSPLLTLGIGMGYINSEFKEPGTIIQFEVRGKLHDAIIGSFPLYDAKKYGGKRKG